MRGLVLGLLASALVTQGASAEWAVNHKDPAVAIIEGVSTDGKAVLRLNCRRAATELSFLFANGLTPTHVSYQIDGGKWNLEESKAPGPGLTLKKPYSYATIVGLMRGTNVRVMAMVMGQSDRVEADFDMRGLQDIVKRYGDLCLFGPAPPRT